jgi:hypothetical protein
MWPRQRLANTPGTRMSADARFGLPEVGELPPALSPRRSRPANTGRHTIPKSTSLCRDTVLGEGDVVDPGYRPH